MFPKSSLVQYGFIALPLSFAGLPLYVHAPAFYASYHGTSLTLLSISLLALRLFDAVQDPFIGRLSDRYASLRLKFMTLAGFILVAGFFLLFQLPNGLNPLAWFTLMVALSTTAFSILSINLNALGGLWGSGPGDKTRIAAWREAFGLLGLLVAVLLPPLLQQSFTGTEAFAYTGVLLCLTMMIGLWLFRGWYRKQAWLAGRSSLPVHHLEKQIGRQEVHSNPRQTGYSLFSFKSVLALPSSQLHFFAIYGLSMLASSMPALLVVFFIQDRLQAASFSGLFLGLYFISGALAMPLWHGLSVLMGKYRAWLLAMVLAICTFSWASFLGSGDIMAFSAVCALSGIAFSADLILPPSILADHIRERGASHRASLEYGLLSFLAKAALALSSVIALPMLELAGFTAGENNSQEALLALSLAYAAIPCAIKLISAVWLGIRLKVT